MAYFFGQTWIYRNTNSKLHANTSKRGLVALLRVYSSWVCRTCVILVCYWCTMWSRYRHRKRGPVINRVCLSPAACFLNQSGTSNFAIELVEQISANTATSTATVCSRILEFYTQFFRSGGVFANVCGFKRAEYAEIGVPLSVGR